MIFAGCIVLFIQYNEKKTEWVSERQNEWLNEQM